MKKIIVGTCALLCVTQIFAMEKVALLSPDEQNHLADSQWSSLLDRSEDFRDVHIVYHPRYNVTFFGLEKKHPFDSSKPQQLYDHIRRNHPELRFHRPASPVSDAALLTVHTPEYLKSLYLTGCDLFNTRKIRQSRELVTQVSEMKDFRDMKTVFLLKLIYHKLLDPMKLATQGTIDAMLLALENGWSINLSGGFHHARAEMGSGYCFYADVPLAIQLLHQIRPNFNILLIDLDVHHGDGNEAICGDDPKVFILDMFNKNIFAANRKPDAEKRVAYMAAIEPGVLDSEWLNALEGKKVNGIEDAEYLAKLEELYTRALEECTPDFIFYNAGTDTYREDPLGRMNLTKNGIVRREALIFQKALERKIPICMVPSGGYAKKGFPQRPDTFSSHVVETSSAVIICESLTNIFRIVKDIESQRKKAAAEQSALQGTGAHQRKVTLSDYNSFIGEKNL